MKILFSFFVILLLTLPGPLGAASPASPGISPLRKIDPALLNSGTDYSRVVVLTGGDPNVVAGGMSLTYTLGGRGSTMAFGTVQRSKLLDLAGLPGVMGVFPDLKIDYNDSRFDSTPSLIQTDMFRVREILGVNKVNSSLGLQGDGVKVAVVDTGTDFANPNMATAFATDGSGTPIALDPDGAGIVLTNTTLSKFTNSTGVYLDMLRQKKGVEIWIYLGAATYPRVVIPVIWNLTNYKIGTDSTQYIVSQSGVYHFGLAFEWTPSGFIFFPTLVVDSKVPGSYDTVYMDMNSAPYISTLLIFQQLHFTTQADYSFYDDAPHHMGDGSEVISADLNGDGIPDISAGLLGARVLDVFGAITNSKSKFDFDLGALDGSVLAPMDPKGNYIGVMYDFQGHGSQAAANVASSGKEAYDVYQNGTFYKLAGVAPHSKIIPIKALYIGDVLFSWMWASGFDYDAPYRQWVYSGNHKADIISNSWGFSAWPLLVSGLGYDVVSTLENILSVPGSIFFSYPGTVFTQAMGNGGPGYGTITSPASSSFAISVGASTSWHVAAQFSSTGLSYYGGSSAYVDDVIGWSNRGPSPTGESKPDVVEVGAFAFTPKNVMAAAGNGANAWGFFGGTSQSCPLTAGLAALVIQALRSKETPFDPFTVKNILMSTATDTGNDPFVQGAGRVNASAAVSFALGGSSFMKGVYSVSNDATYQNLLQSLSGPGASLSKVVGQRLSLPFRGGPMESWFAGNVEGGTSSSATFTIQNPSAVPINVSLSSSSFKLVGTANFSRVSTPGDSTFVNMTKAIGEIPRDIDLMVIREDFPFNAWYNSTVSKYYADAVTRLRLQVYNWKDGNRDGVPQTQETSLINTNYAWGDAEEVRISSPALKFTDTPLIGVYQNPKYDSYWTGGTDKPASPVTFNIYVFFYKKVSWSWVSFDHTAVKLGPTSSAQFRATVSVPVNVSAGIYEDFITLSGSNGQRTEVPVSLVVPLDPTKKGVPFVFGSSADGVMYDNGAVYGASDFAWRYESGNWRTYKLLVGDKGVNQGTVKVDWTNPSTSINLLVMDPEGKIIASSVPPGLFKSITREFIQLIPLTASPSNDYLPTSGLSNLGWSGGFVPSQNNGPSSSILQFPINETGTYTIVVHNTLYSGRGPFERFVGTVELNTVLPIQGSPSVKVGAPTTPVRGTISMPVNVTGSSVSSVTYSIDSGSPVDFTGNNSLTIDTKALRDGPHTFTVTATDLVGHTVVQSFQLIVLNSPPRVFIGNPINGSTATGRVNITFFPESSYVSSFKLRVDGSTFTPSGTSYQWDSLLVPDGLHTLRVIAVDQAGNNSTTLVTFRTNGHSLAAQAAEVRTLTTYLTFAVGGIAVLAVAAAVAFYRRKKPWMY